jgi:hypothetical protein
MNAIARVDLICYCYESNFIRFVAIGFTFSVLIQLIVITIDKIWPVSPYGYNILNLNCITAAYKVSRGPHHDLNSNKS